MAVKEIVNRFIPFSIELLVCGGIPPIFIEDPVIQPCNFCKSVGNELKSEEKHHNNDDSTRKHFSKEKLNEANLVSLFNGWKDILSVDYITNKDTSQAIKRFLNDIQDGN